ncbi:MAG: hypothetical protein JNM88_04515 [Chitinophagaceae bacterium]|nr:hypothetical protein [Chitinophagaceae bacterium]
MRKHFIIRFIPGLLILLISTATFSQVNRPFYWTKNYGGSNTEMPGTILPTPDGGRIFCGTTNSNNFDVSGLHGTLKDIWVVKISNTGVIQWQKTYETTIDEDAYSIINTSDGGYAISGTTNYFSGNANVFVLKISNTGTLTWQKTFGSTSSSNPDRAWQIAETTDGGFVITGETYGTPNSDFAGQINHGEYDLFVAKLSSTGTFLWGKIMGGSQHERGFAIRQLTDGNLLVAGRAVSNDGDVTGNHNSYDAGDYWVIKMTPDGNVIWKKCYGGLGDETPYSFFEKNNRYHIIGTTMNLSHAPSGDVTNVLDGYDMWYLALDTAGNIVRNKSIGGTISVDYGLDIAPTLDNQFVISGYTQSNDAYVSGNHGLTDVALIKVDTLGNLLWSRLFGSTDYDDGKSICVNPDSSYSILGGVRTINGDVQNVYGQQDIWVVNCADTSMYQDLYSKLSGPSQVFIGNTINIKLNYGRNTRVTTSDTVILRFVKDSRLQLTSTTRPVSGTTGDTLFWKIPKTALLNKDSVQLKFLMNPALPVNPDSFRVRASFTPWEGEYFQLNNFDSLTTRVRLQNAAFAFPTLDLGGVLNIPSGQPQNYSLFHYYQSQLDTTHVTLTLVKDARLQYISSTPAPDIISGDSLIWNLTTTTSPVNRTFPVTMRVIDTPYVQLGDTLRSYSYLRFHTIDTTILQRIDSLKQVVNIICTPPINTNTTLAPPQGLQWLRNFGGTGVDVNENMLLLSDTTFMVAGYTGSSDGDGAGSPPADDGFAVMYREDGTRVWKKIIGGNGNDYIFSATKGDNNTILVAGETMSNNGAFAAQHGLGDTWFAKLDSAGNTLWLKVLGGSRYDGFPRIRRLPGGNYIVLATTQSVNGDVVSPFTDSLTYRPWLFEMNQSGNIVWQKVYSDTLISAYNDLQLLPGGGFIIGGSRYRQAPPYGNMNAVARLVKTDASGNVTNIQDIVNIKRHQDIKSLVVHADGSITFAGDIRPYVTPDTVCIGDHGQADAWIGKVNAAGALQWQRFYGGSQNDEALHMIATQDGGYLLTGRASQDGGNVTGVHGSGSLLPDAWLVKTDANGLLTWQKTIGGNRDEFGVQSLQLGNNEYVSTANTGSYNNGDIYNSPGGPGADAVVFKTGAANVIRGIVFSDDNGNHIKDPGEAYYNSGVVTSTKDSLVSSSDIVNGFYANTVDTGRYFTKPVISLPYYTSYPVQDTSIFNAYNLADTANFALVPIPGINDLRMTLLPVTPARAGFPVRYLVKYENTGTTTISSGTIRLIKDARTTYDSASVLQNSLVNDTITWNYNNFAPLESREIMVYLKLAAPPTLNFNDTLHLVATVNPMSGDTTPVNNTALLNQLVTGAYDPNDKTESHGPGFSAQLLANGEYLNYVIRFQNTGNDTAFRVLVRDTLNAKLNTGSFEMTDASHPYSLTITNGNQLEWKFDPIILPDSNHSVINSQGYIAYRIRPLANLAAGDSITNRAAIYFDFNPPVMTNTQLTVIDNSIVVCPGGSTEYKAGISGIAYQWQVNDGSGYVPLPNDAIHTGASTNSLAITAPPASYSGRTYRCIVTTTTGIVTSTIYQLKVGVSWTGAINTAWENAGNWRCGTVPDGTTNVFIDKGNVVVSSNAAVRSITLKPGVQFWVSAGYIFNILH